MKNVSQFHDYCAYLDLVGASKIQFIPTTKERYEEDFGWLLAGKYPKCLLAKIPFVEGERCVIARISFDTFDFVFIDPSII